MCFNMVSVVEWKSVRSVVCRSRWPLSRRCALPRLEEVLANKICTCVTCMQVCAALSRRGRSPIVALEFPLVAGASVGDVEDAKAELLRLLKNTMGLVKKADDAPVSCISRSHAIGP